MRGGKANAPVEGLVYRGAKGYSSIAVGEKAGW